MKLAHVTIVNVSGHLGFIPEDEDIRLWVSAVLQDHPTQEVHLRIVDSTEMTELNETYRKKTGPTNVLSFPFDPPPNYESEFLGDIVLCPAVLEEEAANQNKPVTAHWAHLVIHGTLHLIGFDHETDEEAAAMEEKEREVMQFFDFDDPYGT